MPIVSLCPSLTELVFDLGLGDELVGVTAFCVHPADGVDRVERVGGTKDPDVGRIVALRPDLVLLNQEENRREDAEAFAAAGVACHVTFPKTVAETAEMVRGIGAVLGRAEAAEAIAGDIEARARRASAEAAGAPPVRFAYLIWREPIMSVNGDTYTSDLLALVGGVNVFADRERRYPVVEAAALGAAQPDAVLLATEPFPFRETHVHELSRHSGLSPERFHIVDGELLSWYGSRTPRGVDHAAALVRRIRGQDVVPRP